MLKFTLPYPPSVNHYLAHSGHRVFRTTKANDYREIVGWILHDMEIDPLEGELTIELNVYRPRKSGDLDNILKVILDSLQGYVYENDKQIAKIVAVRYDDKHNPRVEIKVYQRE